MRNSWSNLKHQSIQELFLFCLTLELEPNKGFGEKRKLLLLILQYVIQIINAHRQDESNLVKHEYSCLQKRTQYIFSFFVRLGEIFDQISNTKAFQSCVYFASYWNNCVYLAWLILKHLNKGFGKIMKFKLCSDENQITLKSTPLQYIHTNININANNVNLKIIYVFWKSYIFWVVTSYLVPSILQKYVIVFMTISLFWQGTASFQFIPCILPCFYLFVTSKSINFFEFILVFTLFASLKWVYEHKKSEAHKERSIRGDKGHKSPPEKSW